MIIFKHSCVIFFMGVCFFQASINEIRDTHLKSYRSPWAVKKVNKRHALSQFGQRLEDEAKILKSLSHPNIIGFRGFNKKEDGTHALIMEDGHKALLDIIEVCCN